MSSDSATYTFAAPYSARASFTPAAVPGAPSTTAEGSPSARAAVSASRVVLRTPPPAGLSSTRTRTSAMGCSPLPSELGCRAAGSDDLLGGEEADELLGAVALVGDLHALALRGAAGEVEHLGPGVRQADGAGIQAQVGQRLRLHRLLLRRHDPLERGVTRLVDGVPGGHDRRQRRLHGPVAAVGLPLDLRRRPLDGQLAGTRELRDAEPLGEQRG